MRRLPIIRKKEVGYHIGRRPPNSYNKCCIAASIWLFSKLSK